MQKPTNRIFLILFTIGSVALLTGSWLQAIPFSMTEDLGFISGCVADKKSNGPKGFMHLWPSIADSGAHHHRGHLWHDCLSATYSGFGPILGCAHDGLEHCGTIYAEQEVCRELVRLDDRGSYLYSIGEVVLSAPCPPRGRLTRFACYSCPPWLDSSSWVNG
jgi:hypothetical protein